MLRSLFSGISGLRAHQLMMDVVGNNIANVNSVGYKSSNVEFEDTLSQQVQNAGSPQAAAGRHQPGTGRSRRQARRHRDQLRPGGRAAHRSQYRPHDPGRRLLRRERRRPADLHPCRGVHPRRRPGISRRRTGRSSRGGSAVNGVINTNATPGGITLPIGTLLPPVATSSVALGGNLPATVAVGDRAGHVDHDVRRAGHGGADALHVHQDRLPTRGTCPRPAPPPRRPRSASTR